MMQALEAGGIPPIINPKRDELMAKRSQHNPRGWYEVTVEEMTAPQRLRFLVVDGHALKLPTVYLRNLPIVETTVIWIHRDPHEIGESLRRTFPDHDMTRRFSPELYEATTKGMRELVEDRRSVKRIVDVQHRDLMRDAMGTMAALGLPIDVTSAANAIAPELQTVRAA